MSLWQIDYDGRTIIVSAYIAARLCGIYEVRLV